MKRPRTLRAAAALGAAVALLAATVNASVSNMSARARWPGPAMSVAMARTSGSFRHFGNRLRAVGSEPWHRAQDVIVRSGSAAWVEARFSYGMGDGRLGDEDVDVYFRRSDSSAWVPLGAIRTADHSHPVLRSDGSRSDEPGLVSLRIPNGEQLPLGLHSVRFVVRGDHSMADATIAVVPPHARVVVSDVDGTLTEFEHAFGRQVFGVGHDPAPHPGAAALLAQLANDGYTVVYLTARPDIFSQTTRSWLTRNGFPPGLLRTRENTHFGLGGPDGVAYKTGVLRDIARVVGHPVDVGFGNTITDVRAYEAAAIPATHRFFYGFDGNPRGGVRHDDYRTLAGRFAAVFALGG